ncbi:DUF3040 domain-containing protein [Lentzea flaviverrucosa]|uniref:DUF3040 domain-containing protein n=1 Tax=Lentzea flaviverrucosa TaxID=200379 RepID=A0A1H9XXF7_9PSEU|nr:DUF3040 domain-containing protein [Lentzea flaviverrucosa]RDI17134.1 DUF3040 family protein [Lentzea flaviverrucosa]SES50794.1 Protein of unknown function [Lentzea flaviverrucosa]
MLSREEHQRLIDMEGRFRVSDPDLARALSEGPQSQRNLRQRAAALLAAVSFRKRPGSIG